MKQIITLLLLSISFAGLSSEVDSVPVGPQITFLHTTFDYDTIERYSNGTRTFIFYNTGDEPLLITHVKSGCSCTVPSYSKDTIFPGERGEINAKYNTKKPGKFNRPLTVFSNATNSSSVKINITGVVIDPMKKWGIKRKK